MEELQVAEDIVRDFFGLRFRVELLKLGDDLRDGVIAVAALDDFQARPVEAKGAFGHEKDALLVRIAEANARS